MSTVFIVFQATEEARPIIEAIVADNPGAVVVNQPGLVKIDAEGSMTLNRASVEERVGRPFNLQELHIHLITMTGHLDEDDDHFTLAWNN